MTIGVRATNHSDQAVEISGQINNESHAFRVINLPQRLEPGETVVLEVRGEASSRPGIHANPIKLSLEPAAEVTIRAPVIVYSMFDPQVVKVDFGVTPSGSSPSEIVAFSSEELPDFKLKIPSDQPRSVEVAIDDNGKSVRFTLRKDLPWGQHREAFMIPTDSAAQRYIPVEILAEVQGDVLPSTFSVEMGLQRESSAAPFFVRFVDVNEARLLLGDVRVEGSPLRIEEMDCPIPSESCRMLSLALVAGERTGVVGGVLRVPLPEHGQELAINYGGLLVSDATRVQEIDSADTVSAPADLPSVLQQISTSSRLIELPVPEGSGPLLRWRVSNDKSVYGYLVYRSEQEAGPFRRLNPLPVAAYAGEESGPVEYKWRDTSARLGQSYWYRVDVLERSGLRKPLTPPVEMQN